MNRDKVGGVLKSMAAGKLNMSLPQTSIDIPLDRVTQIFFRESAPNMVVPAPGEIRAYFSGGVTVALQLEKWDDEQVSGTSLNFGRMAFSPQTIRQIEFNLDRPKASTPDGLVSGEEIWDFDE
jgi:hypothetical protein